VVLSRQPENETERIIEAKRSERGGWSRDQLAEFGVDWPPPKGWRRWLIDNDALAGSSDEAEVVPGQLLIADSGRPVGRMDPGFDSDPHWEIREFEPVHAAWAE